MIQLRNDTNPCAIVPNNYLISTSLFVSEMPEADSRQK